MGNLLTGWTSIFFSFQQRGTFLVRRIHAFLIEILVTILKQIPEFLKSQDSIPLEKPERMPDQVYSILKDCMKPNPHERLTFQEIVTQMKTSSLNISHESLLTSALKIGTYTNSDEEDLSFKQSIKLGDHPIKRSIYVADPESMTYDQPQESKDLKKGESTRKKESMAYHNQSQEAKDPKKGESTRKKESMAYHNQSQESKGPKKGESTRKKESMAYHNQSQESKDPKKEELTRKKASVTYSQPQESKDPKKGELTRKKASTAYHNQSQESKDPKKGELTRKIDSTAYHNQSKDPKKGELTRKKDSTAYHNQSQEAKDPKKGELTKKKDSVTYHNQSQENQ